MKKFIMAVSLFVQLPIVFGQNLESKIDSLFIEQTKSHLIQEATLKVFSPSKNIDVSFHHSAFENTDSMTHEQPFYTASIGKMFTALSIAILQERGQLNFDDYISDHLSADIMKDLHMINQKSYGHLITIEHLLQHKSGLADYFEDSTHSGQPKLIDHIFIDSEKFWTPQALLQFYKANFNGKFIPGADYHYTDTEYLLLGLIIEKVSQQALHEFFKTEIFKPLGLNNTYLNLRSSPIKDTPKMMSLMAEVYNISSFRSLSADWAGGGIVSTNSDLIKFLQAVMNGNLIKPETLNRMQNWTKESVGMNYGLGIRQVKFQELSPYWDHIVIKGHSGVTGAFLFYCPELDTYISGSLNQTEANREALIMIYDILLAIKVKEK